MSKTATLVRTATLVCIIAMVACSHGKSFYGIDSARPAKIMASEYGLVGDGATDNYSALQTAINDCHANGGGVVEIPPGVFACSLPLIARDSVSIHGEGKTVSVIKKTAPTTLSTTIFSGALNCYRGGDPLPANINAILVLSGATGRYTGTISGLGLSGHINGSYESPGVEFGIVSVGSCSDSTIKACMVSYCAYGFLFPDFWMGEFHGNRAQLCLQGFSIEAGTSTSYRSNYANNCRSWGHYLRGLSYCTITNNACDHLNDPAYFPSRDNWCRAYIFSAIHGCTVTSNGQEMTNGVNWFFDAFDHSEFANNYSSSIGSDYSGVKHVAWMYSTNIMRWSRIMNNASYYYSPNGLTHGSAVPSKHHNIYFESTEYVSGNTMSTNIVRESYHGLPVEAGWGNNVTP